MQQRPTRTSITVGDLTVALSDYSALTDRLERAALRDRVCRALSSAYSAHSATERDIRKSVEAQFAAELAAVPRFVPGATKRSKPRTNPAWDEIKHRRNDVIDQMLMALSPVRASFRWPYEIDDEMLRWEASVETPWDRFHRLLGSVDWYSCYSDDYRVWSAGEARISELRHLAKQLGPEAEAALDRAKPGQAAATPSQP